MGRKRAANLWKSSTEGGKHPSDRVCPDADINYRLTYDEICFEAYCLEMESRRKK